MTTGTVDILIVGGGPAGLAAALQARRDGLSLELWSDEPLGGLLHAARRLENLPGFPDGVAGPDFAGRLVAHAAASAVACRRGRIRSVRREADGCFGYLAAGIGGTARSVILACGCAPPPPPSGLIIAIESKGRRRVHRDIRSLPSALKGQRVAVVGGGEAALDTALSVRDRGGSALLLARGPGLRAPQRLVDETLRAGVEVRHGVTLTGVQGVPGGLLLELRWDGGSVAAPVDHLALCIGRVPSWELGRAITGVAAPPDRVDGCVPGLFFAGDLIHGRDRFTATALGDGQQAARRARAFLHPDLNR